jgi:hypothetical protein
MHMSHLVEEAGDEITGRQTQWEMHRTLAPGA